MIVIVSPTKTMHDKGITKPQALPLFVEKSKKILTQLQTLSMDDVKTLMKVNEKIASENVQRYQAMTFDLNGSSAIDLYDGLQFKSMQVDTYSEQERAYVQEHVRILSGFYGVLHPFDSIYPYRLEMQCKLAVDGCKNLYQYWKDELAQCLMNDVCKHQDHHIVNLTSKEYEKAVKSYVPSEQWIDVIFQVEKEGKRKSEATAAKMARGAMIKYMAKHKLEDVQDIKHFDEDGYQFDEEASNEHCFVFYKIVVK